MTSKNVALQHITSNPGDNQRTFYQLHIQTIHSPFHHQSLLKKICNKGAGDRRKTGV